MSETQMTATYRAPDSSHSFAADLPVLSKTSAVKEKTTYLSALRANVSKIQSEVNSFLTEEMEKEKAAQAGSSSKTASDETKEEEMYGEEDPENDG